MLDDYSQGIIHISFWEKYKISNSIERILICQILLEKENLTDIIKSTDSINN